MSTEPRNRQARTRLRKRSKVKPGFWHDWKREDYDTARFTGKHPCPVCGMRARTKEQAAACCYPLTPGVAYGRWQRRPTDPDDVREVDEPPI